jgi:FtsP/CotA-like multicopper oxidase with cupredoxin domain
VQGRARWLLLLGAGALAVILFLVLRPGGDESSTPSTTEASPGTGTQATRAATTTPASSVTHILITVRDGKPVGGIKKVTVKKGDKVRLVVHSDVPDEVHVHGYDLHKDVEAGGTAVIVFTAKITGRFEAELEDRKEQILDLTVEP